MKVLGISAFFHDAAAALVCDGEIVAAAQEERFSRVKHDAALPVRAAAACLARGGLTIDDVDHVVFYERPLRKLERILTGHLRDFPGSLLQFPRSMGAWLGRRLWTKVELSEGLGCDPERLLFCEHHLSHAASAFLCSPFEEAAILTVDGVGEWATTTIHRGSGSSIEPLAELHHPHSLGLVYSALTAYLGFEVNEGEYKVMGLAAYGTPRYLHRLREAVHLGDDASLSVDLRYFCYHRHPTRSFTPRLEELLGPARVPGAPLSLPARDEEAQRFADIAASLQALTEEHLLALARRTHELTGARALCLAGGVALNCVANRRIAEEGPFEELFVQPAAGDAGGALGAALWATHTLAGLPRRGPLTTALLGTEPDEGEIARLLEDCELPHRALQDDAALAEEVAARLAAGQVGGLVHGRFEWGPRALGARSILADPRDPSMVDRINRKVKYREPFRPFAPAVLAEDAARFFELPRGCTHLLPFMCAVAKVSAEGRRVLPAITHVDGTARVQVVDPVASPMLHRVLTAFRARTGVGALLNTSLNLKDEPLVSSPAEALGVLARSELDFLALGHCVAERGSTRTRSEAGAQEVAA